MKKKKKLPKAYLEMLDKIQEARYYNSFDNPFKNDKTLK